MAHHHSHGSPISNLNYPSRLHSDRNAVRCRCAFYCVVCFFIITNKMQHRTAFGHSDRNAANGEWRMVNGDWIGVDWDWDWDGGCGGCVFAFSLGCMRPSAALGISLDWRTSVMLVLAWCAFFFK